MPSKPHTIEPIPHRWPAARSMLTALMGASTRARTVWRAYVPLSVRARVGRLREDRRSARWMRPRRLGELRRTTPFTTWGKSRGGQVDRYFVAQYMEAHASDIRGRVLEVAGDEYATAFGRDVDRVDILDIEDDNPRASFLADIADASIIPSEAFDCVLVTQLLPFVFDVRGALSTCHRVLRTGGVLLITTPGICRLAPVEAELYGHWWNFTSMSARRLTEEAFGDGNVEVTTYGNVLSAAAYLYGLGLNDLTSDELAYHDPAFQVTIGVRAVKQSLNGPCAP
jgi:SAM-dependent methyltransferase